MSNRTAFVWDEAMRAYDFGPGHPLSPIRTILAYKMIKYCGLLDLPNVEVLGPVELATAADLLRVHDSDYLAAVRYSSDGVGHRDLARGLGTDDVPIFEGMHDAAARVAGGTLAAAKAVHSGGYNRAINIAGGLHHAMPGAASGFCIYNDIGVAIAWLLEQGVERIGYVDVDVHHGDGVQTMFYDDPRVMTVSVHESGRTLFPGTGRYDEVGGPNALGTAVNLELRAGTDDNQWLRSFDAVVPDVLRAFKPQILVTQQGCDSHREDPLAHLNLTIEGQRASYLRLDALSDELCDGRWIAVGGGGYDWVDVVPRAWAHLVAIVAGAPISVDAAVPTDYRALVSTTFGFDGPQWMGDGVAIDPRPWDLGYDPLDPFDRVVLRVRDAVYPLLGLVADPY